MVRHLINLTFKAGSDEPIDTDRCLCKMVIENGDIDIDDAKRLITKANKLCDPYSDDEEVVKFPVSYDEGLNIDTLIKAVDVLLGDNGHMEPFKFSTDHRDVGYINQYAEMEIWQ